MSLDGGLLGKLISEADPGQVAEALVALDEPARRALAGAVRKHLAGLDRQWDRLRREAPALLVAGAGCLPTVAEVVVWLRRADLSWNRNQPVPMDDVARVLAAPGRPAFAAVARQLADRLRMAAVDGQWPMVYGLLNAAGVGPRVSDALVRGWARHVLRAAVRPDVRWSDEWLPVMVPQLFEVDGVGADLREDGVAFLLGLCRDGRVGRAALLTGCLHRMRAGDRATPMRHVLSLYLQLDPTLNELAEHTQEFLGLLSSPHAPVAEAAQRALRELDGAGRLPLPALVEAGTVVLLRSEKKLVRAQLGWLDAVARREPGHRPEVVTALATGLGNAAVDLAERALSIIAKHLPGSGAAGPQALREAAAGLTGDLASQAYRLLGEPPPVAAIPVAVAPVGWGTEPAPSPVASVGELAGEVSRLLRHHDDPALLERVLDGLVRWVRADREGLVAALAPNAPPWGGPLYCVLRAAAGQDEPAELPHQLPTRAEPDPPPRAVLASRLTELAAQIRAGAAPAALLATPATTDGHVDPDRVLRLLVQAERDGWQPGGADLIQALLRLPREVDPAIRDRAATLTSPAGRRLRHWLDGGGPPDPQVTAVLVRRAKCTHGPGAFYRRYQCWCTERPAIRMITEVRPAESGLDVPPGLFALPAGDSAQQRAYGAHWAPHDLALWPGVLPSHREVVAAHLQPYVAPAADRDRSGGTEALPALARCAGPFGPAMALCLAYGLAVRKDADRLFAVDALVLLAGRDQFDGELVGRLLAELTVGGVIVLRRVVDALGEAARAGVESAVWAVASGALPPLLRMPEPRPGLPDLLALAAGAATATGARHSIPEVAEVAGRPGRSRLVAEARRLSRVLT